jgi:phosphate transport system protein
MRQFFEDLRVLEEKLLEMARLVALAVSQSMESLVLRQSDSAHQVIANEDQVDRLEIEIDELAVRLIALNQPVASDARLIVVALKINKNLERMGDLALAIARNSLELLSGPTPPDLPIAALAVLVEDMVRDSLQAFVSRNAEGAKQVLDADRTVDEGRNAIYEQVSRWMQQDPPNVRPGLSLMSIARCLERIADHSTNIAEETIFLVRGVDVRHTGRKKL